MSDLASKAALPDYQKFIDRLIKDLGFDDETVPEVFMLLIEEVGEFAKAARKVSGVRTDAASRVHDLEEEAADVFWYLLDLCNRLNIDLEQAFRAKVKKNQARTWQ